MPSVHKSPALSLSKGFTLIELLVVIAIIAILSVVGIAVFKGVTGGARDSTRRADIDAVAKAYEIQKTSGYIALSDLQFASGKKPQDPNSQKGDYFNWLATDGSGFKVCASLDDNPNTVCNTPAANCYCKVSSQGTLNPSSPVNQGASTNYTFGLGGSSQQSCDPNGTLLSGLVGYWKMDEGSGTSVSDSSGRGNSGNLVNSPPWQTGAVCTFGSCILFPDTSNYYALIPITSSSSLNLGTSDFTVSGWVTAANTAPANNGTGLFGKFGHADSYVGNYVVGFEDSSNHQLFFAYRRIGGLPGLYYDYSSYWGVKTLITWVKSGNTLFLYLNGSSKASTDVSSWGINVQFYGNGSTYYISHTGWVPGTWPNIVIDDHRIYNRALSQSEVTNLYNGGNGCIY